jgi:ABC-2 type transport system permease protein
MREQAGFEAYLAFTRLAFRRETTYRVDVLTSLLGVAARLYLLYALWTALYQSRGSDAAPEGFTLPLIVTYSAVSLLYGLVVNAAAESADQVEDKIRDGDIAVDLFRPVRYPLTVIADGLGAMGFGLLQVLPALLLLTPLIHLVAPPTPEASLLFVASALLGIAVNFCMTLMLNLTAFWILETFGIQMILRWVSMALSGAVVPVWFFPGAFQAIALALPFQAIYSTPLSIYVGKLQGPSAWAFLGLQAFWVLALGSVCAVMWTRGVRKVVVQGG